MTQAVAQALAALKAPGTFATRLHIPATALHVEVKGLGRLPLPVTTACAEKLRKLARPAPFGLRDATLHDATVRHTWELPRSRVKVPAKPFKAALKVHLEHIRETLGFAADCRLEAELDKLLIYERGQFFKAHQDSERDDHMVGTLVVLLPSEYSGGTLTVEHAGERKAFRRLARQSRELSLLAFYADCHHEVSPVTRGHRVALTYHLLLKEPFAKNVENRPRGPFSSALHDAVRAHFEGGEHLREGPPDRLVYLLDHEYSERSLSWGRLKGADRPRADALKAVASAMDCDVALALAHVHEVWHCAETGGDWRRGRWRFDESLDPRSELNGVPGGLELLDLCENAIELSGCRDTHGTPLEMEPHVEDAELCFTTPSGDMDPFESTYEGYQGNYGNTLERWYHRAAIVLWPRERAFALQARRAPAWAVQQLADLSADETDELVRRVRTLLPTWRPQLGVRQDPGFATRLLSVTRRLPDPDLALALVDGLQLADCKPRGAQRALARLVAIWGEDFGQALLARWDMPVWQQRGWAALLPGLSRALSTSGGKAGHKLAGELVEAQAEAAHEACSDSAIQIARWLDATAHTSAATHMGHVLVAAAELPLKRVLDAEQRFLLNAKAPIPLALQALTLVACTASSDEAACALSGSRLHRAVISGLRSAIAAPTRPANDWSLHPRLGCKCGDCAELAKFLGDEKAQTLDWPLAQDRRHHIHQIIDAAALPVEHTTRRQGRPYILQLRKLPGIKKKEAEYRRFQRDLLRRLNARLGAKVL